jgi:hypothetical protein
MPERAGIQDEAPDSMTSAFPDILMTVTSLSMPSAGHIEMPKKKDHENNRFRVR